jgi:hypothetical protein
MERDEQAASQPSEATLNKQPTPAQRTVYDEAIAMRICDRHGEGESLEAILAEPGMPTEAMFNQWLVEHEDVGDHFYRKWKTLDVSRSEAIVCTDESKPKYKAPDWPKFYPLLGPPPVLSTESAQSYNNLITGFAQTLQPRDMMELIYVKEVTDATWEQARYTRQKTQVPERRYQQCLAAQATCQGILARKTAGSGRGNGEASAVESILTKPLTELDPRQSFEAGFPYYQSLDAALMRAIKGRDNAVRQLDQWRDGLGLKACRLSNLLIAAARNGAAASGRNLGLAANEPLMLE